MKIQSWLLILSACILLYLLELTFPSFVFQNLALNSDKILQKPWTLITYMFVHDVNGLSHIFYNMFALVLFGYILENIIGSKKFTLIYFASGITAGLCGIPFYHVAIGASGAIFGVLGTLAVLRPRMTVWALGVPMPMIVAAVVWAFIDLVGFFGADNIAHIGHLAGLGTGIIYGLILRPNFRERKRIVKVLSEDEIERWEDEWMN